MALNPFGDEYEYRIVDKRAVGKDLPFSVAISKPIEGHLIKENLEFDAVWLNVRTIFRAYHSAYGSDERPNKSDMIQGFLEELSDLKPFIEQLGYDVHVYYPMYQNILKYFPDANPKLNTSPKQRIYADWENSAIEIAVKEGLVDQVCNYGISGHKGKTVMITHYPSDLLSLYNFGDLTLLESNTGSLKIKSEWNTKLGAPKDIAPRLPFNLLTLQVFGDKAKLFSSLKSLKAKKTLLELAEKKKWTPYTTKTKITLDIKSLEKDFADIFSRMISIKLK